MNSLQPSNNANSPVLSLTTQAGLIAVAGWTKDLPGDYNFMGCSPDGVYFDVMAHYTPQTKDGYYYVETKARYWKSDGTSVSPDTQTEVNCYSMCVADEGDTMRYTIFTPDRVIAQKFFQMAVRELETGESFVARMMETQIRELAARLGVQISVELLPYE